MDREFWMGPSFPQQPRELLNRLKSYGVCVVADALKGFNAMNGSIQPVVPGKCICGCAVTVRLHPGDNLLLHKAIESAQPGDILVLDTNSSYRRAVIGGIMSGAAFGKGIGGLVVDGAVRDVEELRAHGCVRRRRGSLRRGQRWPRPAESPHQLRRCAGPSGRYHPGG